MRLKQLPFFSNVGAEFFNAETEGDILYAQKLAWEDPNNEMQSWDPTLFNPRTWFHMTCNDDKYVIWTCDKQLKKFMNLEIYFQN